MARVAFVAVVVLGVEEALLGLLGIPYVGAIIGAQVFAACVAVALLAPDCAEADDCTYVFALIVAGSVFFDKTLSLFFVVRALIGGSLIAVPAIVHAVRRVFGARKMRRYAEFRDAFQ
jgi:hypothetical protein